MKKTLIDKIPYRLPREIDRLIGDSAVYDSSSSPEARVYYIARGGGYYLKISGAGTLRAEAEMSEYFASLGLGVSPIAYRSDERDFLLSPAVPGEDLTSAQYLAEPERLAELIGIQLRRLHETDFAACPRKGRLAEYIETVEKNYQSGEYDKSQFPDSFGYKTAEEAYAVFSEGRELLTADTLIHGDFCLPNIVLADWRLSGFIDLGAGGVADRHIDLFWGAWTLGFNLGTDKYRERFFDAYGRDKVDPDKIRVVAAAEVFG